MFLANTLLTFFLGLPMAQDALNKSEINVVVNHAVNKDVGPTDRATVVADRTDFPYQAALQVVNGNIHLCSASLIDNQHLLTSAYCVHKVKDDDIQNIIDMDDYTELRSPEEMQIVLGTIQIGESTNSDVRILKHVFVHENFDWRTGRSDVCVVRIVRPIEQFSETINKIAISTSRPETNTRCVSPAWFASSRPGVNTELESIPVSVISRSICELIWANIIGDSMFCTVMLEWSLIDCQGEFGSPLICDDVQSGIVTAYSGCEFTPGVVTDLSHYNDWIEKQQNRSGASILRSTAYLISLCIYTWIYINSF